MLCAYNTRLQMRQKIILEKPLAMCKKCKIQISHSLFKTTCVLGEVEVQDVVF